MGSATAHDTGAAHCTTTPNSLEETTPCDVTSHAASGPWGISGAYRPWVLLHRCDQLLGYGIKGFFPGNSLPFRVFMNPFLWIRPFYRVQDPVWIVKVQ